MICEPNSTNCSNSTLPRTTFNENIAVDLAVWAATVSVSVFILLSIVLVIIVTVIAVLCKRRMSRYFAIDTSPSNQMGAFYHQNALWNDNMAGNPHLNDTVDRESYLEDEGVTAEDSDKQHLVSNYVNFGQVAMPMANSPSLSSMPSYSDQYWKPGATLKVIYQQLRRFSQYTEVPRSSVKKEHKLGEGEFGEVFKGEWTSPTKTLTVALKLLKSSASDEERLKLLQEAAIMGQFIHPHIVRLYAVVTLSEPATIVMEYIPGSDLRTQLLQMRERGYPPEVKITLLRFCREIADAMEYLSKKGFIHRDLAARNILLTAVMKCKLADFGMSHDMDEDYYYKAKGGMIPIKWTAPEAILYRKYTTKSDVWSYGMVMYEIWSLGYKPFEDFSIEEIVRCLSTGYCHPPPPGCPRAVYTIMVKCWDPDHHKRINFAVVSQLLKTDPRMLFRQTESDGEHTGYILGAPLSEGKHVFKDLQQLYSE